MKSATVRLFSCAHVGPIDRRIFGGFLEHLGRAVYEGAYDPGNPLSDERGFRKDVLALMRGLRMATVRYPGGNFASAYDWRDGVGPREQRPVRADFAWQSIEPNSFGTDEFVAWCRAINADPMITVNLGTGTAADAAAWVEYCNFPGGTTWSDLRIANHAGNRKPHDVKLWCLGNELDGPWQAGHVPAAEYALRADQAARLMRGIGTTPIELIAAGSSGKTMPEYMQWDRTVLEYCWDSIDYIAAHRYSNNRANDTPAFLAEGVELDGILDDYAALLRYVRARKKSAKHVHLSFDEWNVWYRARGEGDWSRAPHLLEEVYNLEDALVCAQYLNAFMRRADVVKLACLAQVVNVIAPVLTRAEGVLVQSIYHPFAMLAEHVAGVSLTPFVDGPTYHAGERGDVSMLDAAAAYDQAANALCVSLVNRSTTDALRVTMDAVDLAMHGRGAGDVLTHDDAKAHNDWDAPQRLQPTSLAVDVGDDGRATLTLPRLSHAVVRTKVRQR